MQKFTEISENGFSKGPSKDMMKRLILLAATLALFSYPSSCLASYLVQLTNGNQFITYAYWEDDAHIRFYSGGGAIAVAKGSVNKITKADAAVENRADRSPIILSPKPPDTLPEEDELAGKTRAEKERAGPIVNLDFYKGEKLRLQAELDKALEGFREASGNKDGQAKKQAISKITEASGQMLKLTEDLKATNNGILPDWWQDW